MYQQSVVTGSSPRPRSDSGQRGSGDSGTPGRRSRKYQIYSLHWLALTIIRFLTSLLNTGLLRTRFWVLNFIRTQLILCPMWITSTRKHYIAGMRKTLYYLLLPHPILLSISHPSIDLKLLKKTFLDGALLELEPKPFKLKNPWKYVTCCWLQSIIVCCVSLEHSTGGDTMLILTARWLESASLRILGHFLPPCVTNNGQVKHSPPWGHLAPSTQHLATPGVSSWNIEIVGILSSPVQTYLFLFLSLSYVISKVQYFVCIRLSSAIYKLRSIKLIVW